MRETKSALTISYPTNAISAVFEQLNNLLTLGGFQVKVSNSKGEEILAQRAGGTDSYSMAQMSDGERNAVILAANVLTVDSGTALLIDEPERHLHRSIIEPLLSALFASRQDCYFVISTHEIGLPMGSPESSVILLAGCGWDGRMAKSWDARLLPAESGLPEDVKRAILGARKTILFVEGGDESLDVKLYGALFEGTSVVPVGSCTDVVNALTGLHGAREYHDVECFGLIDGDSRSLGEAEELRSRGIYVLDQYSVESIYYCTDAMAAVAERQAKSLGKDAPSMVDAAKETALVRLGREGVGERMAARLCERRVHDQIRARMPDWKAIRDGTGISIGIESDQCFDEERSRFQNLLSAQNLEEIVRRYPVRESGVFDEIAKQFELTRYNYGRTLCARVRDDVKLAEKLRGRIGPLSVVLKPQEPGNGG